MNIKPIGLVLATTAAVLMTSTSFAQGSSISGTTTAVAGQVHCQGANTCKGQSLCRTANNTCKGLNSCKGQGWVLMTPEACKNAGGTVVTE